MRQKYKSVWTGLLTLLVLMFICVLVFRDHLGQIVENLSRIPPAGAALLLALALAYQGFEAAVCRTLVRGRLPEFTFRQAVGVTFLGVFGNVSTLGVGTVPMQSYYLYRQGLEPGRGVGVMTLEYVFHKAVTVFYAALLLAVRGRWLYGGQEELTRYLLLGYGVCILIITVLVLVCTWERMHALVLWLVDRLPRTGKWEERKGRWRTQLDALYTEAQHILKDRVLCFKVAVWDMAKLFCLCCVPYAVLCLLQVRVLSLEQAQLLAALMLVITGALPNVAGMGPAEFAFLLLFSPYMAAPQAASALVLYRGATYFFPFFVSVFVFLRLQRGQGGKAA